MTRRCSTPGVAFFRSKAEAPFSKKIFCQA
jgi:hypothetical protein